MARACTLVTHHSVEYLRKGRRNAERGVFRLDVPVAIEEPAPSEISTAMVRGADGAPVERLTLYGWRGVPWRRVAGSKPSEWNFDAQLQGGELRVGKSVDAAAGVSPPQEGEAPPVPFDADGMPGVRIIADDREQQTAAAKAAAAATIMVRGRLMVRTRLPEWVVSKAERPDDDVRLLADPHVDWGDYRVRDHMRFRFDRLAEAQAWARVLRGGKVAAPRPLTETELAAAVVAGPWHVAQVDPAFLRGGDDVIEFARGQIRRTVDLCASCIEVVPPSLRRRWEELRGLGDCLTGATARQAAEEGLGLIPSTLAMLEAGARDMPIRDRATLMRQAMRIGQLQRRATLIEGVQEPAERAAIDEADLAEFAP